MVIIHCHQLPKSTPGPICFHAPWWTGTPAQLAPPIRSRVSQKSLLVQSLLSSCPHIPIYSRDIAHHRHKLRGTTRQGKPANLDKRCPSRSRHGWATRSWCSRSSCSTSSASFSGRSTPWARRLAGSRGRPPARRFCKTTWRATTLSQPCGRCLPTASHSRRLQALPGRCLRHADEPLFS
jgi:hypothetical protein